MYLVYTRFLEMSSVFVGIIASGFVVYGGISLQHIVYFALLSPCLWEGFRFGALCGAPVFLGGTGFSGLVHTPQFLIVNRSDP